MKNCQIACFNHVCCKFCCQKFTRYCFKLQEFKCNFKTVLKILFRAHTAQNSQNKWTKISGLETNIFELKISNDGEKWSRIFYFEILLAPSELPANLPGQFSLSGQIFLHWAVATLKGLVGFQNKKLQTTFHPHFQLKNVGFMI